MSSRTPPAVSTANDRFKRGFGTWFWIGLILATLAHAAVFLAVPAFAIQDMATSAGEVEVVPLPEIDVPEPPPDIVRPAEPVFGDADVDPSITIPTTDPDAYAPDVLPPPPGGGDDLSKAPVFTPTTVRPRLLNADEVRRALEGFYPPVLRDAGIGGTVRVWFFLDAGGTVVKTLVDQSSGYGQLDEAALRVADRMEFSPAENRDQRVPVWVSVPITFEVQR